MTVTVNPPLVALGQAKPALEIEIVSDLFKLALADEKTGEKARHHLDHLLMNRLLGALEALDQFLELFLPSRARLPL